MHNEQMNSDMSFTLAKFNFPSKCVLRTAVNSLLLRRALVFFIRKINALFLIH